MYIDNSRYVVLDVETNGLNPYDYDLLSISLYKPDDGKVYNRFLPLEINNTIFTTHINGITKKDISNSTELSQEEVDNIIKEFDLNNRTILTYGNIDEWFLEFYFVRKRLKGIENFTFYNFKHDVISSNFSHGQSSKDNLCIACGISGVTEIHSGLNDCILEWKLFEKMNGNKWFISNNCLYELNDKYFVPASYLDSFNNFRYTNSLPSIKCSSKIVKEIRVNANKIKKFQNNSNGIIIEHKLNTLLGLKPENSYEYLIKNKKNLKKIAYLNPTQTELPIILNSDGTISYALREHNSSYSAESDLYVKQLNEDSLCYDELLLPVKEYIEKSIFKNEKILMHELVTHSEKKVLAVCDLSSSTAVLEIKTGNSKSIDCYKSQLFYQSNNRKCYIMQVLWDEYPDSLTFRFSEVSFETKEINRVKTYLQRYNDYVKKLNYPEVSVTWFTNANSTVELCCKKCEYRWRLSYQKSFDKPICPICSGRVQNNYNGLENKKAYKNYFIVQLYSTNRYKRYYNNLKEASLLSGVSLFRLRNYFDVIYVRDKTILLKVSKKALEKICLKNKEYSILQISNGIIIDVFSNINEASVDTGVDNKIIKQALKRKTNSCYNDSWKRFNINSKKK